MSSRNSWGDFAGITDQSRVRKPPGGDTNDIFNLERRQRLQADPVHVTKNQHERDCRSISSEQAPLEFAGITEASRVRKPPGGDTNDIFNLEKRQRSQANQREQHKLGDKDCKVAPENEVNFAGITEKTRVRKPPGGDTNDIFDLESRQRSQAMELKSNQSVMKKESNSQIKFVSSDLQEQKETKNVSDAASFSNLLKSGQLNKNESSLYQLDKENVNLFLDDSITMEDLMDEVEQKRKQSDNEEESKLSTKKYVRYNPITGEVSEVEVSVRSKLGDCSNVVSTPTPDEARKSSDANRTSIRVRQPPGGASSNIF